MATALEGFSSLAEELAQATSDLIELGGHRGQNGAAAASSSSPGVAESAKRRDLRPDRLDLGHAIAVSPSARLTPVFDDDGDAANKAEGKKSSRLASSSQIVLEQEQGDDDGDDALPSAGLSQVIASVKSSAQHHHEHHSHIQISTLPASADFDRRYSPFLESHKAMMKRRVRDGDPATMNAYNTESTASPSSSDDISACLAEEAGSGSRESASYDLSAHGLKRGDAGPPSFFLESFPDSNQDLRLSAEQRADETKESSETGDASLPAADASPPTAPAKALPRPKALLALASRPSERSIVSAQQSDDPAVTVKLYGNRRRQREAEGLTTDSPPVEAKEAAPALTRAAALFSTPLVPSLEEETISGRNLSGTTASSQVDLTTSALLSSSLDSDGEHEQEEEGESIVERASLSSLPATSLKTSSSQGGASSGSPSGTRRRSRSRSSFSASSQLAIDEEASPSAPLRPFARDVKLGGFSVVGDRARGYVCYEVRIITTTVRIPPPLSSLSLSTSS